MKIPFTNIEIFNKTKSGTVEINKDVYSQTIDINNKFQNVRPRLDPYQTVGDEQILLPIQPLPAEILYDTARYSDVLRTVHQNLRKEIFRHGYDIKEIFSSKCTDCEKEFETVEMQCDECGSFNMKEPDVSQKTKLKKYCKNVNDNGQDLINVCEELEDDENTMDDAYLLCVSDYYWTPDGEVMLEVPVEFVRMDAKFMRIIADKKGVPGKNQSGDKLMTCLVHRNTIVPNIDRCPQEGCGRKMFPAFYRSDDYDGKYIFYAQHEVCHRCYDEETELLTERGWIKFPLLSVHDKVATLKDNMLHYEKPTNIFDYDYSGKIVRITGRGVDLKVTPNHRMYVKSQHDTDYSFVEAKDLTKFSYRFKKNANWHTEDTEYFILPKIDDNKICGLIDQRWEEIRIPMDLWVEFLGYFVSEGSASHGEYSYHIGIAQSNEINPEKYQTIKSCLNKLSGRWYAGPIGFGLTHKQLHTHLISLGYAHEKFLPEYCMSLSIRQSRILLDALLLGDGSITYKKDGKPAYCVYNTSSKKLADQVQTLALHSGYAANISQVDVRSFLYIAGRRVEFKDTHEFFRVNISGYFTGRNTLEPELETKQAIREEEYTGKVYCAEVSGGVLYVRRNGKACWCGNSKYNPSLTYGFSVIYSIWMKVVTLMNMDNYMKNYYSKQRPPRGLLFVNTPNIESLEKAWLWMLDMFKQNPHQIPPIAVEQTQGSKGNMVQFIDFMKSMDEMQFIECRNEFRRQIGAVYGVMPLFNADISASGGLNNEGLQITVTNRAIKDGQGVYNDGFYPFLCNKLQITDYKLILHPSEEQDLVAKEDLQFKRIQNARAMKDMGFDITLTEEGTFEYDPVDEPLSAMQQQPMGGMPATNNPIDQQMGVTSGQQNMDETQEPTDTGFSGQPDTTENYQESTDQQYAQKSEGAVTSTTPGVFNPVASNRRKKYLKSYLDKVMKEIAKTDKDRAMIMKAGEDNLNQFIQDTIYQHKFDGMSKSISEKIKDYIIMAHMKKYEPKKVVSYIKRKGTTDDTQAELIYRTENNAIKNKVREWAYKQTDPDGVEKYKWVGPNTDGRTTKQCLAISDRTKEGVTIEELKSIIKEEADNAKARGDLPKNFEVRDFLSHYNCRHSFIRAFD